MQGAGKKADVIMKGRIQHPMYTAAALTAENPVLLAGEVVYESDTGRHKLGDGVKGWNALPYAGGGNFEGNIPAAQVTQDATHRFATTSRKRRGTIRLRKICRTFRWESCFPTMVTTKLRTGYCCNGAITPGATQREPQPFISRRPFMLYRTVSLPR